VILSRKQVLSITGAVLLVFGLFLPAVSISAINPIANISGSSNFIQADGLYGVVLLLLSVFTVGITLLNRNRYTWILALSSLAILIFRFLVIVSDVYRFNNLQNAFGNSTNFMPGQFNGMEGVTEAISITMRLNFAGWVFMFAGAIIAVVFLIREDEIEEIS